MTNIVLIASGDSISNLGKQLQKKLAFPESLSIVNTYMEQAVEYARRHLPAGTDVIIARGNTAKLLKASHIPVPIVTIPIKDSELIRSISTATELYGEEDSQIAYIGMEDVIQSVSGFLDILHRKIRLYSVENSQDIYDNILRAKREHINIVIGGVYTQELAEKNGLKCVLLESSMESLKEAYERALEVQKGVMLQRKKLQERIIMMNAISDGIIGINEKGRINLFNSSAQGLLRYSEEEITGKPYSTLFSGAETAIINRILLRGDEIKGHAAVIRGAECILDFHPVMIKERSKGVIIIVRSMPDSGVSATAGTDSDGTSPRQPAEKFSKGRPAGKHPAFLTACSMARRYAPQDAPVLIVGESGTGKTAFAKWIHDLSSRSGELFLIRDSRLLSLEDFLSANRGTLYIRDIEQISDPISALLAGLLETHTIILPNHTYRDLDVRIIAGSTQSLPGPLPDRLYYSLNTFLLPLPALRQRKSDICPLFSEMAKAYRQETPGPALQESIPFPSGAEELLESYFWPGNLSQLKSLCRRFTSFAPEELTLDFIKKNLDDSAYYAHLTQKDFSISDFAVSAEKKGFMINHRLVTFEELLTLDRCCQGHKGALAKELGVSRSTLWRYFKIMDQAKGEDQSPKICRQMEGR